MAASKPDNQFFKTVYDGEVDFDTEKFLVEVNNQFQSESIQQEVLWRMNILKDIAQREDLEDVSNNLRRALTRVFCENEGEDDILSALKDLTEIEREDGESVDLRRFKTRGRRTLSSGEYREFLAKKIENTHYQIQNLSIFYPEAQELLTSLKAVTKDLERRILDPGVSVNRIIEGEKEIRESGPFQNYESLKERFLRDWLAQFADMDEAEIANLSPEQIQELVATTQRHQLTQLLRTEIILNDSDMTQHLGLHDTLEATFREKEFWDHANQAVKNGFRQWVLGVVQVFGMPKGRRYVLCQRKDEKEEMLLFGLGFDSFGGKEQSAALVPYIKPFTRKSGYLLEIRKRDLGDESEYHQRLRHAVLPFVYAFDQMKEFTVHSEVVSFFTSGYQSN